MAKILWHVTMSLDGFIASPGDGMDWIFRYAGPNPEAAAVIPAIGSILAGRRSYEAGRKPGESFQARKPYGGAWNGPSFVLTTHAPDDEDDPSVAFLSGSITDAVAIARQAAEGKDVVVFGAATARQCLGEGLIDEILVHLAPVLLGDGVRLFGEPGAAPIDLETVSVTPAGQVTNLRFRVLG